MVKWPPEGYARFMDITRESRRGPDANETGPSSVCVSTILEFVQTAPVGNNRRVWLRNVGSPTLGASCVSLDYFWAVLSVLVQLQIDTAASMVIGVGLMLGLLPQSSVFPCSQYL